MIDIKKAYIEFNNYVSNFNPEEGRIKLKIDHIKRVAQISKNIAKNLKLNEEQIKLAELIGLFHDIGRFEQVKLYNTFNDKISFNHAELSVKILFEKNHIAKYNIEEKYLPIIKLAILNHNKDKIDSSLQDEELLFAKIIRDADKIDIFYTICNYDFKSIFWYDDFNCMPINSLIMNEFITDHFINYSHIKTNSDQIPTYYAYIFDLNFNFSLKELKKNKYLEIFTERVYTHFNNKTIKQQVKQLLEISNQFLNTTILL